MNTESICIIKYLVYVPGEDVYFIYETIKNREGKSPPPAEGECSPTLEGAWKNFNKHKQFIYCAYDSSWTYYNITGLELEDIKKKVLVEKLKR